jgi:hypothetical protein
VRVRCRSEVADERVIHLRGEQTIENIHGGGEEHALNEEGFPTPFGHSLKAITTEYYEAVYLDVAQQDYGLGITACTIFEGTLSLPPVLTAVA